MDRSASGKSSTIPYDEDEIILLRKTSGFGEAKSPAEACAPQDERTTSLQSKRISRVGMSGDAIRSNIAATAATPISRHG
jgi:hypothetical protein